MSMPPVRTPSLVLSCAPDLGETDAADWQAFLAAAQHQHPRQDLRFATAERADGRDVRQVIGRDPDGTIRAVGLFSLRRHPFLLGAYAEAHCLSGPVCDDAATLCAFLDGVVALPAFARVGRVKVTPFWLDAEAMALATVLGTRGWNVSEADPFRQTGWVDLAPPINDVLAAFSKSARREVRRAQRQGITVAPVTDAEGAATFLESLNRMRRGRGLSAVAPSGFLSAFETMNRAGDTGIILEARHEGSFIAGLQLYRSRLIAHGRHFTTETDRLRALSNLRIAPLLWLEGMRWARDCGCTALDVEGWRADTAEGEAKYNLYKYKSEFSPSPIMRISERSRCVGRLVDLTGNLQHDLRAIARRIYRRLT